MNETIRWLQWLYGAEPDGLLWVGGHGDGWRGRTFTDIEGAADYAAHLDAQSEGTKGGVYHRLTTVREVGQGRGTAADSAYLPGFAMDLDIRGPGHKAMNYPETEEELITLLRKAGLPEPSTWVHSGGGRYPFWRLEQPADLTLPGVLEEAAGVSAALHKLVIAWAADAGWKVDNTSDLARVYRLPGTHNRKGDEPVVARVLWGASDSTVTYSLADIGTALGKAQRPAEQLPAPLPASTTPSAWEGAQLFGGGQADAPRTFTTAEAMEYARPVLDALAAARDGEINNRLNDAAITMAHFGEEFWSREGAEQELMRRLATTAYDEGTWQASTTIASAYNAIATKSGAEFWRAVLRPDISPPVVPDDTGELTREQWLESQLVSAEELAARPAPVPLVYDLLDMNSEAWMIGEPGSFKSFVALDLAAHVGAGRAWQGHRVRQEPVLYLAAEGAAGMTLRTRAWQLRNGRMDGVDFLPLPLQVSRIDDWQALVSIAARRRYGLVVIDTQARVTKGLDENTAKDAGIFIDAVTALRLAAGACVLTVHHTGRDGKNARGSSAIDGAQDTELKLERETPRNEMRVRIKEDKQKDMAEGAEGTTLKLAVVDLGQDPETERELSSLVLLDRDAWRDAEQRAEDVATPGQEIHIAEPEPWVVRYFDHHMWSTERRLLQAFADLYVEGGPGATEARMRDIVLGRWFEGRPLNKQGARGHLKTATWDKAWGRVVAARDAEGELLVTNVRGERWAYNPASIRDE